MKSSNMKKKPVCYWPSHTRFASLIGYCTRGTTHNVLQCGHIGDHIAETTELFHDDIDPFLWDRRSEPEGQIARQLLNKLEDRILQQEDLKAAETLYAIATEASRAVLNLYLRHRKIFDHITPNRKFLPSLFSIHPNTTTVTHQMFKDSQLGTRTDHVHQIGSRAYFVNDSPANIYARAIIASVSFNQELEPVSCQQYSWKEFDRNEKTRTVVLPFPKFVANMKTLPVPITTESVMTYWRKGKEMILEEMPQFYLAPEWESYRRRQYKGGAKPGAIKHAIFKDILVALKSIAGSNKGKKRARSTDNFAK